MIAGPLLLLVLPMALAGIVYISLRLRFLSALLSVVAATALGAAVLVLPMDQPMHIWGGRQIAMGEAVSFLGRELLLEQGDRTAMAFLFFTAAGLFLLAWRFTSNPLLFPVGLAQLGLLSGALLVRPLIYAALLVEIAAIVSVFALQPESRSATGGGLRYLTFTTLALPGVMITHWLLERYAITPDEIGLLSTAGVLLVVSFALLLGIVPFHTWVPAVVSDGAPLAGAFVLLVGYGAIWFLLIDFLEAYPWISQHPSFSDLVVASGMVMAVLGGLLAPAQRRLGRLIGFGVLVDTGGALIALGMNSRVGLSLVFLALFVRPFGFLLMASGLSGLQAASDADDDRFETLSGAGWKAPWSTVALALGGLSVAGLPLSAGFVWRWALYRALSPSRLGSGAFLLLAGLGTAIGVWRALAAVLTRSASSKDLGQPQSGSERWPTALVLAVLILGSLGVGFFPQVIAPVAARLAETYTFFLP